MAQVQGGPRFDTSCTAPPPASAAAKSFARAGGYPFGAGVSRTVGDRFQRLASQMTAERMAEIAAAMTDE